MHELKNSNVSKFRKTKKYDKHAWKYGKFQDFRI